jgi:hypothetical protein
MLSAFDTLTSHLLTTFSALSTALARSTSLTNESATSRVYLAILVGPSLGAPKSKVIYGVDRFETRIWGRVDHAVEEEPEDDDHSGDELLEHSDGDESVEEAGSESETSEESDGSDLPNEESDEGTGDEEIEEEGQDDDESNQKREDGAQIPSLSPHSPYKSYAEEQRFLQNADRLLARTLASADANDNGIANEMSTYQ